jgi:hypothetical protein
MIIPEFVELEFCMPFYEMYYPDFWNDNKLPKNPFDWQEDYFNQSLWRMATNKAPYNKRSVHHFEK